MNKYIALGRWTKDTDYRCSSEGTDVARNTMAIDRVGEGADFVSCVAFGKTAQFMEKYAGKGIKMLIEGRIQTGSYTNKDGKKVYTTDVVVERCEFAESKAEQGFSAINAPIATDDNSFMAIPDDIGEELPFN